MTYIVKLRGSPSRTIAADYECPTHGRFEVDVERDASGDAPDVIACPVRVGRPCGCGPRTADCYGHCPICNGEPGPRACGEPAEYRISSPLCRVRLVEAIKGKSEKPARATYTDTRNVADGQPVNEWWEDRAKVWEEKRKADVVAFAKEHHERVIGGD